MASPGQAALFGGAAPAAAAAAPPAAAPAAAAPAPPKAPPEKHGMLAVRHAEIPIEIPRSRATKAGRVVARWRDFLCWDRRTPLAPLAKVLPPSC